MKESRRLRYFFTNPGFLALFLVPLLLGVKHVNIGGAEFVDVYSWYKSAAIIVLGLLAVMRPEGAYLPALRFTLPVVLSCLFISEHQDVVWTGFPNQYFGGLAVLALIALVVNAPDEDTTTKALSWGSIPISLLAIWPNLFPWQIFGDVHFNGNDSASTLYNANYVGLYAATVLPFLMVKRRFLSGVLLSLALVKCGSLSSIVALFCALALAFAVLGSVISLSFIVGTIVVLWSKWKPGLDGRLEIWQNTIHLIKPFGSGLGAFPLEYPQTVGRELVDKPHNFYLQFMHAFGWAGGVLASSHLFFNLRARKSLAYTAGLTGFAVAAICNDLYIGVAPIVAIMIGHLLR